MRVRPFEPGNFKQMVARVYVLKVQAVMDAIEGRPYRSYTKTYVRARQQWEEGWEMGMKNLKPSRPRLTALAATTVRRARYTPLKTARRTPVRSVGFIGGTGSRGGVYSWAKGLEYYEVRAKERSQKPITQSDKGDREE